MAAPSELKLHSLARPEGPMRGPDAHDGKPARLLLTAGKSSRLREVPLTREQLLRLAEQALVAVRTLDRQEAGR